MPFATIHRTVQAKNFLKTGIPPVRPAGFPNLLKTKPSQSAAWKPLLPVRTHHLSCAQVAWKTLFGYSQFNGVTLLTI
jgi:hypothetical protein